MSDNHKGIVHLAPIEALYNSELMDMVWRDIRYKAALALYDELKPPAPKERGTQPNSRWYAVRVHESIETPLSILAIPELREVGRFHTFRIRVDFEINTVQERTVEMVHYESMPWPELLSLSAREEIGRRLYRKWQALKRRVRKQLRFRHA